MLLSHDNKSVSATWEDVFDVPGEGPVQSGVEEHHDDGQRESVGLAFLWTLVHVVPLNPDALLLIFGKVLAAVAKGHAREDALEAQNKQEKEFNSKNVFPVNPESTMLFHFSINTVADAAHVRNLG